MCSTVSLEKRVTLTIHDGGSGGTGCGSLLKDSTASLFPSYTGSKINQGNEAEGTGNVVRTRVAGEGTGDVQQLGPRAASGHKFAEQPERWAKPWLRFGKVNAVNKGTGGKDMPVTMDRGTEAGQEQKHVDAGEGQSKGGGQCFVDSNCEQGHHSRDITPTKDCHRWLESNRRCALASAAHTLKLERYRED